MSITVGLGIFPSIGQALKNAYDISFVWFSVTGTCSIVPSPRRGNPRPRTIPLNIDPEFQSFAVENIYGVAF